MLNSQSYKLGVLFFSSILIFACGDSNTKTTPEATTNVETVEKKQNINGERISDNKPDIVSGICANEYYPIIESKKRKYTDVKNPSTNYVLTQTKNDGNTFTEIRNFGGGMEITNNWLCTEDGLRNAEYNNGARFAQGNFRMETLESSGISLPKKWEVGKKWTTEYKISAKLQAGAASSSATGTIKIDSEIISLDEKIQTSAGEFDAAKVSSNISMNLNIGKPMNMKMTNWYAPNVGIVKQEMDSPFGAGITTEYAGEN